MKNSFSKLDWPAIRTRKIFTRNDLSSLKKESECDKQQSIGSDHAAIASPEEKQLHCDSNTISSSSAPLVDKGRQKALPLNKRKKRQAPPPPYHVKYGEIISDDVNLNQPVSDNFGAMKECISPSLQQLASNLQEVSDSFSASSPPAICSPLSYHINPNEPLVDVTGDDHTFSHSVSNPTYQCISPSLLQLSCNLHEASNHITSQINKSLCDITTSNLNISSVSISKQKSVFPSLLQLASNLQDVSNRTYSTYMLANCQSSPIPYSYEENTFSTLEEDMKSETCNHVSQLRLTARKFSTDTCAGIDHLERLSKNLENVIIQPSESINKCLVSDTPSISFTSNSKYSGSSQTPPVGETPSFVAISSDQSGHSKKKGPAPPRPVPPKREIRKIPGKVFEQELKNIEVSQLELQEHENVLQEQIQELMQNSFTNIHDCRNQDTNDNDNLDNEKEDAIIMRLDLINDIVRLKIDLFRLQTILMHLKKDQFLEAEHANLEHQIRESMARPEVMKTKDDKNIENDLIRRLSSIVGQRNEIIDSMENDRLRELEEDKSIELSQEVFDDTEKLKDPDKKISKSKKGTKMKSIHDMNKRISQMFK